MKITELWQGQFARVVEVRTQGAYLHKTLKEGVIVCGQRMYTDSFLAFFDHVYWERMTGSDFDVEPLPKGTVIAVKSLSHVANEDDFLFDGVYPYRIDPEFNVYSISRVNRDEAYSFLRSIR